jgi:hypothetical protein
MIERIKAIVSYYGMSDRAFALKCGIKQNTFSNQVNGARELSLSTVNAILISFEDISSEWLIRGKGEMLNSKNQSKDENTERISRLVDTIATLQGTINEQSKTIQVYEDKVRKLNGELTMLKNERNIR